MNSTPSQLRWTGLFLACGIGLMALSVAALLGSRFLRDRMSLVCALQGRSVYGLSSGAKVLLRGIEVGSITGMAFDPKDPERILVDIEVDRSAPVYKDATATLEIFGITGLKYLELVPGTPAAGRATSGTVLLIKPSTTDAIVDKLDTVARTSALVLQNLDNLTGAKRQLQVDSILLDLRGTSKDLASMAGSFRAMHLDRQVAEVMGHVERTSRKVDSTMAVIDPARTMARIDTATGAISDVARRADLMLGRSQGDIYRTLEDLSITMRNLSDFSQSIRDNPAALLGSRRKNRSGEDDQP
ncbi:MAG TPA: MlaD family protein [Fibrobacteria bacterium]|nr:MlaD family protein [Fibrobacteria bacterium]